MRLRSTALAVTILGAAIGGILIVQLASRLQAQQVQSVQAPSFTLAQATAGQAVYAESCASCHGANLDDGTFAPAVAGVEFRQTWFGRSADVLFEKLQTMPPGNPGSLGAEGSANVMAFLLSRNQVSSGDTPLPGNAEALKAVLIPGLPGGSGGGLSAGVSYPTPPPKPNPLDRITPVTEAVLTAPPAGAWPSYRRTYEGHNFSPLRQINKQNVDQLRVAWTWTFPNGSNENTPLVHDGVLFTHAPGDRVLAFDAVTGDLLWQYARRLPQGVNGGNKRAIALYGNKVFTGTSDLHVVALDIKTGRVAWDSVVAPRQGYALSAGVTVAKGKVIASTTGRAPGGNFIVAFDAESGKEAWRLTTIPKENEPGAHTWNGQPVEERHGGSVWAPGSYDPTTNLVYFGTAQTYNIAPYLEAVNQPGINNDLLYMDSTLAINPDTGKLVWHFQHFPNDVWDYDWAFGRIVMRLRDGRTVVGTGGKQAIYDFMDADSGKYAFSYDVGLQDVITGIDPKTGAKQIDRRLTPVIGKTVTTCPHAAGAKNWMPEAYNPEQRVIFVALTEACMDLGPVPGGGRGMLSGLRWTLRPRPGSDGKYGRLEAFNVETRRSVWKARQRAPMTSGTLATAGGVVFAGGLDRVFTAYDDATGKELWNARLNDVPNSAPMTYEVNGKQYIALNVGGGGAQAVAFQALVPEMTNPPDRGTQLWVFELPDRALPNTR